METAAQKERKKEEASSRVEGSRKKKEATLHPNQRTG